MPESPDPQPDEPDVTGLASQARARTAFDDFFRARLQGIDFEPIDPTRLATRPAAAADLAATAAATGTAAAAGSARWVRWLVVAAAAALLVGVVLVAPRWRAPEPPVVGLPQPTPSTTTWSPTTWSPTARSPLTPRYDALAVAAGGRFYLLGGYTGLSGDILWGVDGAHGEPTTDAASYDPATNAWTLLPAFDGVFSHVTSSSAAVLVGDLLYVVSPSDRPGHDQADPARPDSGGRAFAVLDLRPGGGWTALPAPPATATRTSQVMLATTDGLDLFAEGADGSAVDVHYDLATATWSPLPAPPADSLAGPRRVLVLDQTHVLASTRQDLPDALDPPGGHALWDSVARTWRAVALPDLDRYALTGAVDGVAAGTGDAIGGDGQPVPGLVGCGFSGVAGQTDDSCRWWKATQPEGASGLAARQFTMNGTLVLRPLDVGSATAVSANLFDPATGVLWPVPRLPGVGYDTSGPKVAVMAAGGDTVLSCFAAWADDENPAVMDDACYLLRVPDPLPR